MNTSERIDLLTKFDLQVSKKIKKVGTEQQALLQSIAHKNSQIDLQTLPEMDILLELSAYHKDINQTVEDAHKSISSVTQSLTALKNRKENTSAMLDIFTSILQVKELSYSIKADSNITDSTEQLYRTLASFYSIRAKTFHCEKYIHEIQTEIDKIEVILKDEFDKQLKKTNSENIKDVARVIELIKSEKQKNNGDLNNGHSSEKSRIADFYVSLCKKELQKYEQELFNIPIVGPTTKEMNYIFFDIAKNALKVVISLIQTYEGNILKLEGFGGLHAVSVSIFRQIMENLISEILQRQKKYFEIDKISISRSKLTLKDSQYNTLKLYFKEFNAIWNQVERFRLHVYEYLPEDYQQLSEYNKELIDITNSATFVEFNFEIILYFQAFFRHQLDRLLKKNPFIVSLWQLQEQFLRQVRDRNEYDNNLAGHDFIEEMILKFSDGVKKSFETLNTLIVSALINFVNHNLIYEDSFYAFTEIHNRCIARLGDARSVEGLVLLLNTVSTYPKAIRSSFGEIEVPAELPKDRIKNEINELISNNSDRTHQFLNKSLDAILEQQIILEKVEENYADLLEMFKNLSKDLLERFVNKLSQVHVEIIRSSEFGEDSRKTFSSMDVLNLQKELRSAIKVYETKSHSIRAHFRTLLDYVEVMSQESEGDFEKLLQELSSRHSEQELRRIWALRS